MSELVLIGCAALVVIVVLAAAAKSRSSSGALPLEGRPLMTAREREAAAIIEEAVPHCRVHAQVAMGALIQTRKGLAPKQQASVRNRFDGKRIDFVLEERANGHVLALVELDDQTHNSDKDRARDSMTEAAGYRTIRLRPGKRLDPTTLRRDLLTNLAAPAVA